jgi:DNA-binding beta-propeller fold protein YncE
LKKQINDIRIKNGDKANTRNSLALSPVAEKDIYPNSLKEKFSNLSFGLFNKKDNQDLMNPDRRKLLKIVAASGGVLIAGSFLNKLSGMNSMSLGNQASNALGSIFSSGKMGSSEVLDSEDMSSFFQNFRIVKNDKEYILYNKEGDNILIIDRDA